MRSTSAPIFWSIRIRSSTSGSWAAGLIVVRPLIFAGFVALLCAAIWQYALDQRSSSLINGVATGLGGIVFYSLIDMLIQPTGAAAELIWQLATAAVLWFVVRRAIRHALAQDALAFTRAGSGTIICPNCRRLTPDGTYCANCGAELHPAGAQPKPSATIETSLPEKNGKRGAEARSPQRSKTTTR